MKNKQITVFVSFLILVIISGFTVSAQKTTPGSVPIDFKNIVGKWNYVQVKQILNADQAAKSNILPPADENAPPPKPKPAPKDTSNKKTGAQAPGQRSKTAKNQYPDVNKGIRMFINTTFEFTADKKAVLTNASKSEKYSWKKGKDNILIIKNLKTNEKFNLEIQKLTSDTLKFEEHFTSGGIKALYRKNL